VVGRFMSSSTTSFDEVVLGKDKGKAPLLKEGSASRCGRALAPLRNHHRGCKRHVWPSTLWHLEALSQVASCRMPSDMVGRFFNCLRQDHKEVVCSHPPLVRGPDHEMSLAHCRMHRVAPQWPSSTLVWVTLCLQGRAFALAGPPCHWVIPQGPLQRAPPPLRCPHCHLRQPLLVLLAIDRVSRRESSLA
jgi:hypothetical protein